MYRFGVDKRKSLALSVGNPGLIGFVVARDVEMDEVNRWVEELDPPIGCQRSECSLVVAAAVDGSAHGLRDSHSGSRILGDQDLLPNREFQTAV